MNEPHDHHFVPRFYLAGWCSSGDKLTVYSRPRGRVVTRALTPKYTAVERDLYSYTGLPSPQAQSLETDFMARIDDAAAPVLRKLLNGGLPKLTGPERSDFTRFVMLLRARHPGAVAHSKEEGERTLTNELDRDPHEYLAVKCDHPAATLRDFLEQGAPHYIPNAGLSVLPDMITNPKTCERVYKMPWSTFDVRNANVDLLSGDRPCILEGDALAGRCVIALPLGPRMLMVISNDSASIVRLHQLSQSARVKLINRAIVICAHKYVYGTGPQHLPLVEKLLTRPPRPHRRRGRRSHAPR
jgi:Protein of unknown function (DUF4238)